MVWYGIVYIHSGFQKGENYFTYSSRSHNKYGASVLFMWLPPLYFALALTTGIALTSLEGQQPEFFFNITVSWFNGDEKRGKKERRKEGKNRIRYPQRRSRDGNILDFKTSLGALLLSLFLSLSLSSLLFCIIGHGINLCEKSCLFICIFN